MRTSMYRLLATLAATMLLGALAAAPIAAQSDAPGRRVSSTADASATRDARTRAILDRLEGRSRTRANEAGQPLESDARQPVRGRRDVAAGPAVRIRLDNHAVVRGTDVRLTDVARIEVADEQLHEMLTTVSIARRPNYGFNRQLTRIEILRQLALAGVQPTDIEITGSQAVVLQPLTHVLRPGVVLETARETLTAFLSDRSIQDQGFDDEYEIAAAGTLRPMHVPPGRISFELSGRVDVSRNPAYGRASVLVDVVVDGEVAETTRVDFTVTRFFTAMRLTRPLEKGTPLGAANLEPYREVARPGFDNAVRSLEDIQGKVAGRRLSAGRALLISDLAEPAIVRQGDLVRIVAKSGGVHVVMKGLAQEDAARGERVRVLTLTGRRSLHAIAVAPNLVTVTPN